MIHLLYTVLFLPSIRKVVKGTERKVLILAANNCRSSDNSRFSPVDTSFIPSLTEQDTWKLRKKTLHSSNSKFERNHSTRRAGFDNLNGRLVNHADTAGASSEGGENVLLDGELINLQCAEGLQTHNKKKFMHLIKTRLHKWVNKSIENFFAIAFPKLIGQLKQSSKATMEVLVR